MQHDVHEFLMHMLSTLQDEETPVDIKKFDGDVSLKNKNRSLNQIYEEYFSLNPSCIDKIFTGILRSVVKCA